MRSIKILAVTVFTVLATTLSIATPTHASSPAVGADTCGSGYVQKTKVYLRYLGSGTPDPNAGYLAVYRSSNGTGSTACGLTVCGPNNCNVLKHMTLQLGRHGNGSSTIYWEASTLDDGHYKNYAGPRYLSVPSGSCASAKGYIGAPFPDYSNLITTSFCR